MYWFSNAFLKPETLALSLSKGETFKPET